MFRLSRDLRFGARALFRQPTFLLVAAGTLALGIGASTSIFSVLNGIVLRPLPYESPDQLVRVWNQWEGSPEAPISPAEYFDYLDQLQAFSGFGVYGFGAMNLTDGERPEQIIAGFVSEDVFEVLGTAPLLGRHFNAAEHAQGGDPAIMISEGLWRRRYGASREVIGSAARIAGEAYTIVGVMPQEFALPETLTGVAESQAWTPLGLDRSDVNMRGSHFLNSVARLRPGVTPEAAGQDVAAVARRMVESYPDNYPTDMRFGGHVESLSDVVVGDIRPTLLILLGAVTLVLLIACVNVSSLLLIRSDQRRQEMGVRLAMGAGRASLLRQLGAESLVLAGIGAAGGLFLAVIATEALVRFRPPDLPRIESVSVDWRVIAFAMGAAVLTSLAFGLIPALQASNPDLQTTFRDSSGGNTAGASRQRLRNAFVATQIALALAITLGAGLLVRSSMALQNVDPGYATAGVLTMRISLPESEYPDEEVPPFYAQMIDRLGALPGVDATGAVTNLPLATSLGDLDFNVEGRVIPDGAVNPKADWQAVTPGYFEAMGIRIVRGRSIDRSDAVDAPGAVVINQAMADRYWPGEDPIGQRFLLGAGAGPGWVTVVGIANNIRHASLREPAEPEMYIPHAQFRTWGSLTPRRSMTLVMRTDGDPISLVESARAEIRAMDPALPASEIRSMATVRSGSLAETRFTTLLLAAFAFAALLLSAIGVYGAQAYAVTRRKREIGIRIAVGARAADLIASVLRQGLKVASIGLGIGLVVGLATSRVLESILFEVSSADPLTFLVVPAILLCVALAASWIPARRAAGIDPMRTLRAQ